MVAKLQRFRGVTTENPRPSFAPETSQHLLHETTCGDADGSRSNFADFQKCFAKEQR